MIKQVHFRNWGTGPKSYWRDVSSMAMFVAASLQYHLPPYNRVGPSNRVSTIRVDQYKEKFGDVRIYCTLAHSDEVQAKWIDMQSAPATVTAGKVPDVFVRECFLDDAVHYRQCYMAMAELVPHLRDALCDAADYAELLGEDEKAIDERIMPHARKYPEFYVSRYGLVNVEELRDVLLKIYKRSCC